MPRGGAKFSSAELARVLSYYDVGIIHQAKALIAGNRRAPKMVIISQQGKFLLKRRPKGKDDLYRVAFAHEVQIHLAKKGSPVATLVTTREDNNTVLQLDNHIYEFFKFISGVRYDGSVEATIDAGRQLARLHTYLQDFECQWKPLRGSFHDSSNVRRHLKTIGAGKNSGSNMKLQKLVEDIMIIYNNACVRVNELGFDSWQQQVVHGDWHPGNMLFSKDKLTVILDFDSVKIAPHVTDLANGMLQFSIVGNRPNPAEWPDYLDQAKLIQFLKGYQSAKELDKNQQNALLDLMIETIIAEAVLPIAATGFFGHLSGFDFLKMIHRKAKWIDKNRNKLIEAFNSEPSDP